MAHQAAAVACMKDPTKRFGEIVRRIKDTGDEGEDDVAVVFPILNREMLDQNLTGAISGDASVDHFNRGLVVTVQNSWGGRRETKIGKDGAKVPSVLGGADRSIKFSFSGAGGGGSLGLTFVSNTTASKKEHKSSGRASLAEVIGVGCIKETCERGARGKYRKGRRTTGGGQEGRRARRETMVMGGATEVETPSASGAKIFGDLLEHGEVKIAGCRGELA